MRALLPRRRRRAPGHPRQGAEAERARRVARALEATRRDERGVAFPSPVVALSVGAIALAGVAFVATDDGDPRSEVVAVSRPAEADPSTPAAEPPEPQRTKKAAPVEKKKEKQEKPVERGETYVVVFNNTNIAGLAGSVASQAAGAGWQVVGSDNWVGTIPSSTVYYPPRLEAEGRVLARDLGIDRVMPSVEPMQFDRLTVILTGAI